MNAALSEAASERADRLAGGNGFISWGKVADRLTSLGASRWRETISEAKECGCSPDLALTLIDYGTSKSYGVGAIICRLAKARPTLPVEAGWPEAPKPATAAPAAPDPQAARDQRRYDIITGARKAKWAKEQTNAALAAEGFDLI